MKRHAVIGTAGHVDHGKTSLVKALTGTDTDRLAEEKRRGITIELGFARWTLGPDLTASIIDVPGHERFVQTMVAGATGCDLVLLVVAADDGVMPQTREHLAICDLLGLETGVVAATKADLVDEDLAALLADEIRSVTAGTTLAGAEIVPCSARDGRGLDALTAAVARALGSLRPAVADGPPVLAVDRIFSKPGFGTVVTGTLSRGTIAKDDVLEVVPAPAGSGAVRVRGLYVHDQEVSHATATTRLALNLRGEGEGALARGVLVTRPGWQRPTRVIDVDLTLLPDAAPIGSRTQLVLHLGTAHATVRAHALAPTEIAPGGRGVVRLFSEMPFPALAGQRFILRRPELIAQRTVGGGVILDPHPRQVRRLAARSAPLSRVTSTDLAERIRTAVAESPDGAPLHAVQERLRPEEQASAAGAVAKLVAGGLVVAVDTGGKRLFARSHLEEAKRSFLGLLRAFHHEHPTLLGATAAEIEGQMPRHLRAITDAAIAELRREGAIGGQSRVCLPGHDPRSVHGRIAEVYAARGLLPDIDEKMRVELGLDETKFRDALRDLRRDGRLHRLGENLHVHTSALDGAAARVREHFATHPTLSPVELKALCGLSRKYAMPLLEWLDAQGITRRQGDLRLLAR
jgi:selenocysteine-specific elongation factor